MKKLLAPIKRKLGQKLGLNPMKWLKSTEQIQALLQESVRGAPATRHPPKGAENFAILVNPFLATWVPWYSVVMGLLLAQRGSKVSFIFDDLPFGEMPQRAAFIRMCIRRVLRTVAPHHAVLTLSEFSGKSGAVAADREALIEKLATLNAIHHLRGEMVARGRREYVALVREQLTHADPAIRQLLSLHAFNALLIPGGVFGTSGLWLENARQANIRVCSYDAGATVMLAAANGIAAQLKDIPVAYCTLKAQAVSAGEKEFILQTARAELEKRHQGRDTFSYQKVNTSAGPLEKYRGAILMALNSSWDQAALGLHAVFDNSARWIEETVRWVVENTQATIIIRQHPAERFAIASTSDDYGKMLQQHFGNHPRVVFIAADDPINTYELMAVASTVLTYTSTIGVEAAALGKPVIVASHCYYANLGFVSAAQSRQDYWQFIRMALEGRLNPSQEVQHDATYCYYATQVCNWVFTPFNPVNDEFFSQESIASLNANPSIDLILTALQHNIPVSVLNHKIKYASHRGAQASLVAADLAANLATE